MKTLREYINLITETDNELRSKVIQEVGEDGLRNMTDFFCNSGDFFDALNDDEGAAFEAVENETDEDLRSMVDNADDTFATVRKLIDWKRPLDVETVMSMLDNADVEDYSDWFTKNGIKR